jgi:1-acyl-sn-glycerol-3-phosphate acyltransferase
MTPSAAHARARTRGVNPIVYWLTRAVLQPFAHLYWRLSRIGREHIPAEGPVVLVCNHRSIIDPFLIGLCSRRPIYYVAKEEIFRNRLVGWFVSSLGAFPVRRGAADAEMIETAKAILRRGDPVLMFPEGTRTRPGPLGKPKRGMGRLALETGATVVPVAMIGTEAIRKGWRIRPRKVRVRIGAALHFPRVEPATAQLAAAVTDRVWPMVMLQWEWLGGLPPLRRAAVIGSGSWGTAIAVALARAGVDVDLGTATRAEAQQMVDLPPGVRPISASELDLSRHDLVTFAVPATRLEAAVAEHGPRISHRTGVLVASAGLVAPGGTLPSAYVAGRTSAWALGVLGGPAGAEALDDDAAFVVASRDPAFARQVEMALRAAKLRVTRTGDMAGVELASCARTAAALAAATAFEGGPDTQLAAIGKVVAEIDAFARRNGSKLEALTGLAGADALAATILAESRRDAGQPAEAIAAVPLLAARLRAAGVDAPVLSGLAGIIDGRVEAGAWTSSLEPKPEVRAA